MRASLLALIATVLAVVHFGVRGPTSTSGPVFAFPPSQLLLSGSLTGDTLTETESCASCHADAAAQWQSSAHAFASFNNPIYRLAVDRFRSTVGRETSRFCAGCHDVALLVDGAMAGDVKPGDSRGHGGITCRVCHGIEDARPDGNGSYTLSSSNVPIPRDGDDESLRAHKARMALGPLRTAAMCGSCHRSFLSAETGNSAAPRRSRRAWGVGTIGLCGQSGDTGGRNGRSFRVPRLPHAPRGRDAGRRGDEGREDSLAQVRRRANVAR